MTLEAAGPVHDSDLTVSKRKTLFWCPWVKAGKVSGQIIVAPAADFVVAMAVGASAQHIEMKCYSIVLAAGLVRPSLGYP